MLTLFRLRKYFSRGTRGSEFFANHERDARAQDLDDSQHLAMRKGGDAHLERDARDAAEDFLVEQYFLCNSQQAWLETTELLAAKLKAVIVRTPCFSSVCRYFFQL